MSSEGAETARRAGFPASVREIDASRVFEKALRRRPSSWIGGLTLVSLEQVWLPFAFVSAACRTNRRTTRMSCLVDRIEGSVFGLRDDLEKPSLLEVPDPLLPELDLPACGSLAEHFLHRRLLLARTDSDLEIEAPTECLYPFWVGYHSRQKRLDVRLLDAVTSEMAGTSLRRAFLSGLRAAGHTAESAA